MNLSQMARDSLTNGDYAACVRYGSAQLAQNPADANTLWLLAISHMELRQLVEARLAVVRLLALLPPDADVRAQLVLLGLACSQLNDTEGAQRAFGKILDRHPDHLLALSMLARIAYAQGDRASASRHVERFMAGLGRFDPADAHDRMVEIGKTIYLCSLFATSESAGDWLVSSRNLQAKPGCASLDSDEGFCFGLAALHEANGDIAEAMKCFEKANRLQRSRSAYKLQDDLAYIEKSMRDFDDGFFKNDNSAQPGLDDPVPVFILGMPRSGSSLLEQILASHSAIHPCGETPWLQDAFRESLREAGVKAGDSERNFDQNFYSKVRAHYFQSANLAPGTRFITDKMPANVYKVWLIAKAFPEAKIICTQRDKLATVMSCFTNAFAAGYSFSESVADCSDMYDATQRLVKHWREQLPDRLQVLDYEDVVRDTRATVDALFEFIGLEAEEACYRPHELKRAVGTSSSMQVTRPIYVAANQRWRPYLDHLGADAHRFS